MREIWSNSRFTEEVWEEAEQAGLTVLHPTPDYGTPLRTTDPTIS